MPDTEGTHFPEDLSAQAPSPEGAANAAELGSLPGFDDAPETLDPIEAIGTAHVETIGDEAPAAPLPSEPEPAAEPAPASKVAPKGRNTVADAASGASRDFLAGFSAMRDVGRAKREHAASRARMSELEMELEHLVQKLDHRVDIENRFDQIVADQSAALTAAFSEREDAQERINALNAEHDALADQLTHMQADHEERLRPYRNLMDSTKSRADDAARSLKEIQRAVKKAESALADANYRRDSQVSLANRAVDNANARLVKLNEQLAELDGSADADAVAQVQQSIANEQVHLATAKSEVASTAEEAQRAVDSAQEHLLIQQQSLEVASRADTAARQEAEQRKSEYDRLYQDFQAEEATLDNAVVEREMRARDVSKEQAAAQERMDAAQALLDEANDIHATPERTVELRERIESTRSALDVQKAEVDSLAKNERELRASTKRQRMIFIGVIAAVAVLLIALIAWLFLRPKEPASSTPEPTYVSQPANSGTSTSGASTSTDDSSEKTTSGTSGSTSTGTVDPAATAGSDSDEKSSESATNAG